MCRCKERQAQKRKIFDYIQKQCEADETLPARSDNSLVITVNSNNNAYTIIAGLSYSFDLFACEVYSPFVHPCYDQSWDEMNNDANLPYNCLRLKLSNRSLRGERIEHEN